MQYVAVALLVALLAAPLAEAHAFLVRTSPQHGERLPASPSAVTLRFSERTGGAEELSIRTAAGASVAPGPVQYELGGLQVRADLPPLDDGVYVVSWQALGSDGHLSVGEFAFAVGKAGAVPVEGTGGQSRGGIAWPEAIASWLLLTGLLLAFGGLASERFVWAPVARRHEGEIAGVPAAPLLAVGATGAGLQLGLVVVASPGGTGLLSRPGALAAAELALVGYGVWLLVFARTRPWALVPLAGALVAAAVRGHAGVAPDWWAAPANVAHLAAVGLWLGGLAHLIIVVWRVRGSTDRWPLVVEGAHRYAGLALGLVGLVLATGVATAMAQLEELGELATTLYGRTLLVKLLLVALALGLAFAGRRRALRAASGLQPRLLFTLIRAEGLALGVVLAIAAVLGPPPLEGPVLRLAAQGGWLAVYLAAAEGQLRVRVLAPSGEGARASRIDITGRRPDGKGVTVYPRPCGSGCVTSEFPWPEGSTTLNVTVAARDREGGTVPFVVPWPPLAEDPALLDQIIETMRAQPRFRMKERVTSGPGAVAESAEGVFTGEEFVPLEIYAEGGATDIRPIPAANGRRALTLYIPGSSVWYYLEIDEANRLTRETIVNPGHLIERTFAYDD